MAGLCKVVIICPPERFNLLKEALRGIGIFGMTVLRADGCGLQGGRVEYYRGNSIEIDLLPKTKVELVVPEEKVGEIIATAKKELYTGTVGDGKIFVYDVREVVRISTGATGLDALDNDSDRPKKEK